MVMCSGLDERDGSLRLCAKEVGRLYHENLKSRRQRGRAESIMLCRGGQTVVR